MADRPPLEASDEFRPREVGAVAGVSRARRFGGLPVAGSLARHRLGALSYLEGGYGTPLLLLHGLSSSAASWERVAAVLTHHFRIIAPDLLGFGESDLPSGGFYMEEQALQIGGLLDALGVSSMFVAGHDFGGPVAMTLASARPNIRVHGVVLSNTNMFTDTSVPVPLRAARIPVLGWMVYRLLAGSRLGLWLTYRVAVARKAALPWEEFARGVDARNLATTEAIFRRSLADLPRNYRAVENQLRCTATPALVLWGDRDPFFPPAVGQRTAAALPRGTYLALKGVGHFGPQEDPVAYASAIVEAFGRRTT